MTTMSISGPVEKSGERYLNEPVRDYSRFVLMSYAHKIRNNILRCYMWQLLRLFVRCHTRTVVWNMKKKTVYDGSKIIIIYVRRPSTAVWELPRSRDDFWRVSNQFLQISTDFDRRSRAQMCTNILLSRTHAFTVTRRRKKS